MRGVRRGLGDYVGGYIGGGRSTLGGGTFGGRGGYVGGGGGVYVGGGFDVRNWSKRLFLGTFWKITTYWPPLDERVCSSFAERC